MFTFKQTRFCAPRRIPFNNGNPLIAPLERWQSGQNSDDNDKGNEDPAGNALGGSPGAGAGRGGGGGGSIRSAGGSLGKMAVAQEDSYFRKKTMEELEKLHEEMKKSLESAGKMAQSELDKDKKVEEKMKSLSKQLKSIIDEGKKSP